MTKIQFDSELGEVQVTRNMGKKGSGEITINREGGAIEINLGIAKVGITTDYGGGISLGLLGQDITWGREGGTIHIQVGGFEVFVEARDCIVTETKSIFGQIVAQRSYPDPGCKLPDPPIPPPPPEPDPINGIDPATITDARLGYVLIGQSIHTVKVTFKFPSFPADSPGNEVAYETVSGISQVKCQISGGETIVAPRIYSRSPAKTTLTTLSTATGAKWASANPGSSRELLPVSSGFGFMSSSVTENSSNGPSGAFVYYYFGQGTITTQYSTPYSSVGALVTGFVAFGPMATIAQWVTGLNQRPGYPLKHIINQVIPLGKQQLSAPAPFLPTGNKPPMKDCCEEILDMLEDIKEAMDIDRMLKDGFPVSNTFMAPECDPASVTKAKSFYEIMQCIFRTMAHGMIFEPKVMIKDADAAKAGDQEFKARYLNATGWASAVSEALMEVKDDGNVGTNMDIRNGFAVTQMMVGLADALYKLDTTLDCLGLELAHDTETVETPYNLMIKLGKGFGAENERKLDLNQDEATEALLPEFLQTKKNKIKTVVIHPRARPIYEILLNIEASLSTQGNG